MRQTHLAILAVLAACSSDGSGPADPPGPPELPPNLELEASASAVFDDGAAVTCSFRLLVAWDSARVTSVGTTYHGRMGGESHRQVLDSTGAGIALFADMFWPTAEVEVIGADSIAIDLSAGADSSGSPFWDSFKSLSGRKRDDVWSGPWHCGPFGGEVHDFMDTTYTAPGDWQVVSPFPQAMPYFFMR